MKRASTTRSPAPSWAGYAACAWALVFAAMSVYWALGGTLGAETIGGPVEEWGRAREPWFIAVLWITAVLKLALCLIALALVQPWGRIIPRWLLLTAAWGVGGGMTAYGGLGIVVDGLRVAGVIVTSNTTAARWHLLLWDPWWLLGGLLFIAAIRAFRHASADRQDFAR